MKYIVLACPLPAGRQRRAGCAAVKKEKTCVIFHRKVSCGLKNIETLILNLTAGLLI